MALFHESRRNLKIPRGKYSGWVVSQVPEDYLFWINTAGQNTSLYEWLHKKGSGKPAQQQVRQVRNRARKSSRYTRHFVDHIGHESVVRVSKKGRGIVHCIVCQKDIHSMSEQELLQYLAATTKENK
jgi:MarR-like DNA-binding transcriptional regulator SgrR of sgrS sRNA